MTQPNEAIKVIAVCGSLREGSYTRMALTIALQGAQELGVETQLLDLRDYELVFCDGDKDETAYPPDIKRLRADIQGAHGIILGTPEYHGSFSGVLKNALDLLSFKELAGKMIGLVGVSGGAMGALNALNSLRTVGRSLHAWVIPEQVGIANAWKQFNEDGTLKEQALDNRVREVGRQVARFAFLHNAQQAIEFLKLWERAPSNPGGE